MTDAAYRTDSLDKGTLMTVPTLLTPTITCRAAEKLALIFRKKVTFSQCSSEVIAVSQHALVVIFFRRVARL